jgi:hypothetical protein
MKKSELLEKAQELGIPNCEKMSKEELFKVLQLYLTPIEVTDSSKKNKPIKKKETAEIKVWKQYLERICTTPENFLIRYPNHPFKYIVEQLIK